MSENEENAFRVVYEFCKKWRETVIETDEQWDNLAGDVGQILDGNPCNTLMFKLMEAVLDYFTELYKDGMKPMPAGYLGRDDI